MAKIVIVDDDELIVEAVTAVLEKEGHEIVPVRHGDDAVEAVIDTGAELVILDQMLPGKSGMHILAELREHPKGVDLPIMMLTSRGSKLHIELADQVGADDYVTKPFQVGELPRRVRAMLVGAQISRDARMGAEGSNIPADADTNEGE